MELRWLRFEPKEVERIVTITSFLYVSKHRKKELVKKPPILQYRLSNLDEWKNVPTVTIPNDKW